MVWSVIDVNATKGGLSNTQLHPRMRLQKARTPSMGTTSQNKSS